MESFKTVRSSAEQTIVAKEVLNQTYSGLTGRVMALALIAASIFLLGKTVSADEPQWYIGAGAGQSTLKPLMRGSRFTVTDDTDTGYKVFVGAELTDHLSAELFLADLGSAKLSPSGSVDYQAYGASAQLAFPHNNPGIFGYFKGGVMGVKTQDDLPHDADDSFTVFGGLGAEYQMRNGYSLRGEYERLTKRSDLVSLSLVKRFGGDSDSVVIEERRDQEAVRQPATKRQVLSVIKPPLKVSFNDTDHDGVLDARDMCQQTPAGAKVDSRGCPAFLGVMADVSFEPGSDYLNALSKVVLNQVAREMHHYQGQQFVIVGHSDAQEATGSRKKLSLKRAFAVARHLIERGVSKKQLRVGGYGAAKPRASNANEEGRARNRRIELYLPKHG